MRMVNVYQISVYIMINPMIYSRWLIYSGITRIFAHNSMTVRILIEKNV